MLRGQNLSCPQQHCPQVIMILFSISLSSVLVHGSCIHLSSQSDSNDFAPDARGVAVGWASEFAFSGCRIHVSFSQRAPIGALAGAIFQFGNKVAVSMETTSQLQLLKGKSSDSVTLVILGSELGCATMRSRQHVERRGDFQ